MAEFISVSGRESIVAKTQEVISSFDGVELVETKFFKEYGNFTYEIFLWKKGGVDLNLCEAVHEKLSTALDGVDELFDCPYVLKVSSMGLDRQIESDDDYRRALDEEIEFKDENGKKRHGILRSYDADSIFVESGRGAQVKFDRKYITKVQPYIRF